ncbi:hypothetical protein [Planktothrix agardhii]|nr:hypothetical protein [Planktothrix agardhii]
MVDSKNPTQSTPNPNQPVSTPFLPNRSRYWWGDRVFGRAK